MGAEPVRQRLRHGSVGIGVGAGTQYRHKDLSLLHLPGYRIGERYRLPAVIDKELLAGYIVLTHAAISMTEEFPIKFAVLGVLVSCRVGRLVLIPQKSKGCPFTLHLLLHQGPVRQSTCGLETNDGRIQKLLQDAIIHPLG